MAAYYQQIPVGHVEAGLRTRNRYSPFPEEMNRHLVDTLAAYHFAPTGQAVANLKAEGVAAEGIVETGNTVIDALLLTLQRMGDDGSRRLLADYPALEPALRSKRRIVLATSHRRENLGPGLTGICKALLELSRRFPDIDVVYPVHPNPRVQQTARSILGGRERIHLLDPLEYDLFCYLMSVSHLILTDSGGVQEEAPTLHKPVLVLRDTSERPEAVQAGATRVVGTRTETILETAALLLSDERTYRRMASVKNPYGDGRAADRIVEFLCSQGEVGKAA
jgi:UDP-N-acetylglucosamine 2-epimerase (non-hydrolysing)